MIKKEIKNFAKSFIPKPLGRWAIRNLLPIFPKHESRFLDIGGRIFGSTNPLQVLTSAGFYMKLRLEDQIERRIYYTGRYESLVEALLYEGLSAGGCFVDIGANCGYYSLLAASILKPNGRVYSFEPFPETFSSLRSNVNLNGPIENILLYQLAISNEIAEVPIYLRDGEPALASMSYIGFHSNIDHVTVKSDTLDNVMERENLRKLNFIKIDVEGAEIHVLQGMSQLLGSGRCPNIIIEIHPAQIKDLGFEPDDIAKILIKYGYRLLTNRGQNLVPINHKKFFGSAEGHRFIFATKEDHWDKFRIPNNRF